MPRRLTNRVVQQLRTTEPRRRTIVGGRSRLTSREWQVLNLIASGLSTRQVADHLTLSPTAVKTRLVQIFGTRYSQRSSGVAVMTCKLNF